jgi:hypothetical protein
MRRQFHFLGEMTDEGFIGHDRDEVRTALLDLEGAIFQLGGALTVSAVRREVGPDQFITTGVLMAFDSYVPKFEPHADAEPGEVVEVDEDGLRAS